MSDEKTRTERDSMGEMEVPAEAYYGASTQRAVLNFPISGQRIPRQMIRALGLLTARSPMVDSTTSSSSMSSRRAPAPRPT
jgi:fumarate hydratase class II